MVAVALFDLDHFKHVNDTLGHAAGDALLVAIAARLPELVRARDTVARLGGDEFAILLTDVASAEQAERVVADVIRAVSEPVVVAGVELSVQASAGIACYPDDAVDVPGLLQRADTAMYEAKRTRGSYRRYAETESVDAGLLRLALGAELRRALVSDEFDVHYQPQVDLATGRIVGCEALVRWQHPERGLLLPEEFISVVEQSGFIGDFTLYVLERAIDACLAWPEDPERPLTVAVNLSARNLLDRTFGEEVAARLAARGLEPHRLVLEITETTMLSELDVVEDVLSVLRRKGVQISVDDFGTGYSSLTFLQRVSVNELKIDRTFVASVLESPQAAALVRATIELARSLGLRTVAEGVESAAVADALAALGCEVAQGYRFGAAVPSDELPSVVSAFAVR
jgi:diguanylate cyclase (GGDEF)-like protein